MAAFIETLVNISLMAGIFTIVVIIMRQLFKKAPKSLIMIMWALVALRLVCPFTIKTSVGVMPEKVVTTEMVSTNPERRVLYTYDKKTDVRIGKLESDRSYEIRRHMDPYKIAGIVWAIGSVSMLTAGAVSYLRLKKNTRAKIRINENVYVCDEVDNAFVIGFLKPQIIIPSRLDKNMLTHILRHENTHIRHKDNIWKPLGYILLSINWFNPFIWLAYYLFCKDMELFCDECVIKNYTNSEMAEYSAALLKLGLSKNPVAALAFGEVGIGYRIRFISKYKKCAIALILLCALTMTVLSAYFLTNRNKDKDNQQESEVTTSTESSIQQDVAITPEYLMNNADFLTNVGNAVFEKESHYCPAVISIKVLEATEDTQSDSTHVKALVSNTNNEYGVVHEAEMTLDKDLNLSSAISYKYYGGKNIDTKDGYKHVYYTYEYLDFDMDGYNPDPTEPVVEVVMEDHSTVYCDYSYVFDDILMNIGISSHTDCYIHISSPVRLSSGETVYYFMYLVQEKNKDPLYISGWIPFNDRENPSYTICDTTEVEDYLKDHGLPDKEDIHSYQIKMSFLEEGDRWIDAFPVSGEFEHIGITKLSYFNEEPPRDA